MGYSESSKAYRIYFPGFNKIDIRRNVTIDKYSTYNKSWKRPVEDLEETEVLRIRDTTMNEATSEEDQEIEEPQEPIDPPREKNSYKRKPTWGWKAILDAERYGTPEGIHRERKRPRPYSSYVALLCDIIDKEPSNYEEAA